MDASLQPPSLSLNTEQGGSTAADLQEESYPQSGGDGGPSNLPVRNIIACSNCRSQKIKCFPSESQERPCRRCDKYELTCEYLQHRRGRKKKPKPGDLSTESVNGSPASTSKRDALSNPYLPSMLPKDTHQAQYDGESSTSTALRSNYSREPHRATEGGMLGGIGHGSDYPSLLDNRYLPTVNANTQSFDNPPPRFYPPQPMHVYPGLQSASLALPHVSTPISADRQTANEMNTERAYNTPFALPGLHTAAVTEAQMPPHMEQIASSSQPLLQLPPPLPHTVVSQMHDYMQGNGNYSGRVTPTVSLLNDKTGPANRTSPREATMDASPANSPRPASIPEGARGRVPLVEGSAASTGSSANVMRESSPPIRPIEVRRFPFLSPAIGEGALGRRPGLTPASLPNILNTTSASGEGAKSMTDSTTSPSALTASSNKRPSKFSSLHHMVADMDGDSDSEGRRESSIEDDKPGDRSRPATQTGKDHQHEDSQKRKRRKLNPDSRANSEDNEQSASLRRDPVSAGFVSEGQARELFDIFMAELNISLPLLDPAVHSFDFVRSKSPFLLSATLCAASRFLRGGPDTTPELVTSIPPEKARAVHEQCLRLAHQHMHLAFQHAITTLEVVQAMTLLSIWKEPDDDKAGFYFNRAVVMAKEIQLGRIERTRPRSEEEALWRRIRQRAWLGLFIVNTIFAMQFNQILQITQEDPLIANSFDWHIGSHAPLVDLSLIASVQIRARFLHYKSLLEITAADADDLERTDKSHTATLLSLSILTRTANQDLGNINAHWVEQIREASPTGVIPIKPFIWLAGLRLHLNIVIMNQTIRIENSRQLQRNSLGSIAAFHHSINAACEVLTRMKMLPKRQLAFASDTLLHFTIYAGYFLFTVCTKSTRDLLEPQERQHCEDIVVEASEALVNASLYPADAPALHARFLRRLTSPYLPSRPEPETESMPVRNAEAINPDIQGAQNAHPQLNHSTAFPASYGNLAALPNGFQLPQNHGLPANVALSETIWGGQDDGLWTQFDGAWWDHVMQDMTASRPVGA